MITQILFLLVLVLVNAFFAASEIALISLNDNKIKLMAENGDKKAKKLVKLLSEPSQFLATIQIGITIAGFLASAFAAESFSDPLVEILKQFNLPITDVALKISTVIFITVILAYFTLVLGELVPKRIAMKKSEIISFSVVGILVFLAKLTSPFVKLLTLSTNFFVRLVGIDPNAAEENITEEEIRMMVDVGEEKGTIHEREKMMINNIFEFNNKTAGDIMTHRMELFSVSVTTELPELMSLINKEKYTRIPVYADNIDNIVGILHVKDLIPLINENVDNFSLSACIRKPYFIPTSKKIDELLLALQQAKKHICVVLDEYGGTAGIITVEDLLEEIVGNIFDEYDDEEAEFRHIDDATFDVSGMISLEELNEYIGAYFDAELPVHDYETLSGFLISTVGWIPSTGDSMEIKYNHMTFKIVEVTDKRIDRVIVSIDHEE